MFSHIHVKSVKRFQLGCRPFEQNTNLTDLVPMVFLQKRLLTFNTTWLKRDRLWILCCSIPHFLIREIEITLRITCDLNSFFCRSISNMQAVLTSSCLTNGFS